MQTPTNSESTRMRFCAKEVHSHTCTLKSTPQVHRHKLIRSTDPPTHAHTHQPTLPPNPKRSHTRIHTRTNKCSVNTTLVSRTYTSLAPTCVCSRRASSSMALRQLAACCARACCSLAQSVCSRACCSCTCVCTYMMRATSPFSDAAQGQPPP